jgi:diamine N-acetyltransferase
VQTSLRPIDATNYRECIELAVAPEQEGFVASNLQSLADAYVYRDAAEPYAVYAGDTMVGFALLFPLVEGMSGDTVPEGAPLLGYILVRLMIGAGFQGHGYGREAMAAIAETVRGRGLGTIRLSVVPENKQALEFYRRNGFSETGELEGPEIVMERRL